METYKKVIWISVSTAIIIALILIYFLFVTSKKSSFPIKEEEKQPEKSQKTAKAPAITKEEKLEPEPDLSILDLDLSNSDKTVRDLVKSCSIHSSWTEWIKTNDLIRIFVAVVCNISEGRSPIFHLEFLSPKKKFQVLEKAEKYYIDPKSYDRYNQITNVFTSLNTEHCVRFFKRLKPTLEKAFKELGYHDETFEARLELTIAVLISTPVVSGNIQLEKKVISYAFAEPRLEQLNPAQKHLLRMGPTNIRKIQHKLINFAKALGFDEIKD